MPSLMQQKDERPGHLRCGFREFVRVCALAIPVALLFACGATDVTPMGAGSANDTGSVSVLFTDAPSDDFIAVNLTVTAITLIGGPTGQVTLFEGSETFDLLALRDVSELFAMADSVPSGIYAKIRLTLAANGIELVTDDGQGGEEFHYPSLPAHNKLDLIPRHPFVLTANDAAALEIDIDVDKSIHVNRNGNGEYKFRPVVFVRIVRDFLTGRLTRLQGLVKDIDLDAQAFSLCRLRRPQAWLPGLRRHGAHPASADFRAESAGAGASQPGMEMPDIEIPDMDISHPWRRCIDVALTEEASIFDKDGTPIRLGDVSENERATVVGRIQPTRERRLEMFASLMLMGPPRNFEHRIGIIATEFDEDLQQFVLDLASGLGDLNIQIFPTTKLFERGGMPLGTDAIQPEVRASATGVIVFSSEDPAVMNTAVLILDLDDSDPVPLRGEITEVNVEPAEGECHLGLDVDGQDTGVAVGPRTVIFLIDGEASESEIGELEDLAAGDLADVYGRPNPDPNGCFMARVIVAFPQE